MADPGKTARFGPGLGLGISGVPKPAEMRVLYNILEQSLRVQKESLKVVQQTYDLHRQWLPKVTNWQRQDTEVNKAATKARKEQYDVIRLASAATVGAVMGVIAAFARFNPVIAAYFGLISISIFRLLNAMGITKAVTGIITGIVRTLGRISDVFEAMPEPVRDAFGKIVTYSLIALASMRALKVPFGKALKAVFGVEIIQALAGQLKGVLGEAGADWAGYIGNAIFLGLLFRDKVGAAFGAAGKFIKGAVAGARGAIATLSSSFAALYWLLGFLPAGILGVVAALAALAVAGGFGVKWAYDLGRSLGEANQGMKDFARSVIKAFLPLNMFYKLIHGASVEEVELREKMGLATTAIDMRSEAMRRLDYEMGRIIESEGQIADAAAQAAAREIRWMQVEEEKRKILAESTVYQKLKSGNEKRMAEESQGYLKEIQGDAKQVGTAYSGMAETAGISMTSIKDDLAALIASIKSSKVESGSLVTELSSEVAGLFGPLKKSGEAAKVSFAGIGEEAEDASISLADLKTKIPELGSSFEDLYNGPTTALKGVTDSLTGTEESLLGVKGGSVLTGEAFKTLAITANETVKDWTVKTGELIKSWSKSAGSEIYNNITEEFFRMRRVARETAAAIASLSFVPAGRGGLAAAQSAGGNFQ